jgi:DNA polymerase-3 subunit alpha
MDNYIDFINFSKFSIGSGMSSIDEIVENAKKSKRNYASLTDTNTLSGIPEFIEECQKNDIKPIVGVTMSTSHKEKYIGEITLIAKNQAGFDDLKLLVSSLGKFQNDLHRTIELEEILTNSKNLLMIEGAKNSIMYNVDDSKEYLDIFKLIKEKMKASFIGTIQTQVNDKKTTEMAKKLFNALKETKDIAKTSIVFTNNNRFPNKNDYAFQINKMHEYSHFSKKLEKSKTKLDSKIIDKTDMFLPESYLKTKLSKYKTSKTESLYLSDTIISKITPPDIFKAPTFPKLSNTEVLSDIIKEKWKTFQHTLTADQKPIYHARLKEEMDLFEKLGYSDYFVVTNEISKNAQKVGQTTAIRGSGAASLVVHALGLSPIDPIEHDLMFGRFMNEGRNEAPDLDVETSHNEDMLRMLKDDYGSKNTANLMAFETLNNANVTTKFVINSLRRYADQGFDFQKKVNRVENELKKKLSWYVNTKNVKTPTVTKFLNPDDPAKDYNNWVKDYNKDPDIKYILDAAMRIEGQIKNKKLSVGTVILSNTSVQETLSTFDSNSENGSDYIIEVDKNYIQKMGHLKMDILSSVILNKLNETAKLAKVDVDNLIKDMTDPKVYEAISNGFISHVNQIATRMQLEEDIVKNPKLRQGIGAQMCKEIKPQNYQELTAIMALIRMGEESESGEKPVEYQKYIDGRNSPEKIIYKHPDLKGVLHKTYGAIIFEEQIMRISKVIADFTDSQADNLRSVIKKKKAEELVNIKPLFVEGALKKGISQEVAESIYSDIEAKMGQYQFNEAHACVYSAIAYQQMYMKLNHPAEFYSVHYDKDLKHIYEHEILELGFFIQRPDINNSTDKEQTIHKIGRKKQEQKIMDFSLTPFVSDSTILTDILEEREEFGYFEDLIDYSERILPIYTNCNLMSFEMKKSSKINRFKKETINLIKAGAFDRCTFVNEDDIEYSRSIMIENLDDIIELIKNPHIDQEIELKEPEKIISLADLIEHEEKSLNISPLNMKNKMEKKQKQLKKNYKARSLK